MIPLALPRTVQNAWGEEVAADFTDWFEFVLEERAVSRDEFRQILSRLDILERDVADLKTEVRDLRREMNERFRQVDERFSRVNERFDWMYSEMNKRLVVGSL